MTDVEIAPARVPVRAGQATAIEQSRAQAEVHAAILVAQQCPRDMSAALDEMRQSCAQMTLAERAFFRFPRGGSTVSGPSVHLAKELARCWGNIQYGLTELSRDDEHGQSEMLAFAWDVQKNSRASTAFIVPHKRDKKGKDGKPSTERLDAIRDIYENNANAGARRVRECIYNILPPWFTEEAKEICNKTLKDGGGKPLPRRIADAIKVFERIGVTKDQLERKLERTSANWNEHDVAQLTVTYKSLERNEVRKEDEFPSVRVTAAEILGDDSPIKPDDPDLTAHEGESDG